MFGIISSPHTKTIHLNPAIRWRRRWPANCEVRVYLTPHWNASERKKTFNRWLAFNIHFPWKLIFSQKFCWCFGLYQLLAVIVEFKKKYFTPWVPIHENQVQQRVQLGLFFFSYHRPSLLSLSRPAKCKRATGCQRTCCWAAKLFWRGATLFGASCPNVRPFPPRWFSRSQKWCKLARGKCYSPGCSIASEFHALEMYKILSHCCYSHHISLPGSSWNPIRWSVWNGCCSCMSTNWAVFLLMRWWDASYTRGKSCRKSKCAYAGVKWIKWHYHVDSIR